MKHTKTYFHEHVLDGENVWKKYASSMKIVFAYPNGWGTTELAFLRKAAIDAGYALPRDRIQFVSEAEASVHYCLIYTSLNHILKVSTPVEVVAKI